MSNLEARLFLKLRRESTTVTSFFVMSINEIKTGNSTTKRILGRYTLFFIMNYPFLAPLTSIYSILIRSAIKMGLTPSSILELLTDKKPAFTSPIDKLN